jgi:large subunit ribosomal protein L15
MKLHDLRPAAGSHKARTRVGRGIAAGKGKTAGRGTKGQKARAGGSIPPWFEGGQTPLHMRIPKLRGFKNRFKVDYEVVNIGAIAAAAERGAFEGGEMPGAATKPKKAAPVTVNQELLRAVGLVRTLKKPLKILGNGELSTALFVVADAFTKSAVSKIEAAGGTISVLEVPTEELVALGLDATPAKRQATAANATPATETGATEAPEPKATRATEPKTAKAAKATDAKADTEAPARKSSSRKAATTDAAEAPTEPDSEPASAGSPATAETAASDDESASAETAAEPTPEVETPDAGENA